MAGVYDPGVDGVKGGDPPLVVRVAVRVDQRNCDRADALLYELVHLGADARFVEHFLEASAGDQRAPRYARLLGRVDLSSLAILRELARREINLPACVAGAGRTRDPEFAARLALRATTNVPRSRLSVEPGELRLCRGRDEPLTVRTARVEALTRLQLDHAALGLPLQAVIKVRLGSHDRAHVNALYDQLVRAPGVLQAFHVAGEDDFHLHVAVADAEALRDLVLNHVTVHRVVRSTETQLVFELREGAGVLPPLR